MIYGPRNIALQIDNYIHKLFSPSYSNKISIKKNKKEYIQDYIIIEEITPEYEYIQDYVVVEGYDE